MLQEILNKLNFVMSNTYVNETDTVMDLYNSLQPPENKIEVETLEEHCISQLIEVARRTGKFTIDDKREYVVIEHLDKQYRVSYERFVNGK
jgi:hypothetical protein